MTPRTVNLLGIAGSLRSASLSRAILENMKGLVPEGATLESFSLDDIPLYNGDLESDRPPAVRSLREAIEEADGLVLLSPEYNHSISGVLKNAIDWSSRPAYRSPLKDKAVVGVGVANGLIGGARGIQHLKTIMSAVGSEIYPGMEALVGKASEKLDADGRLIDQATVDFLSMTLSGFVDWIRRRGLAREIS